LCAILLMIVASSGVASAAALNSKEAETMTLRNGTDLGNRGNSARFNADGEEALWTDGGVSSGDSVAVTLAINAPSTTQVCMTLLINNVQQTADKCVAAGITGEVERAWGGLSLSNGDDLLFRSTQVGAGEILWFDRVSVDGIPADTTPPDTSITSSNPGTTNNSTPTFSFTGTDNVGLMGYECRVDAAAFARCTSPHTPSALADGSHTFEVRAKDAANNTDATPASQTFAVDTTAPGEPSITSPSTNGTTDTDGDLSFSFTGAEAGGPFQCSLDTGTASYSGCESPKTYIGRADGSYTFRVRQIDSAGNMGTAATRTITVDVPDPDPYPGVRFTQTVGVAKYASDNVSATAVQNAYADVCTDASSSDCHGANDESDFVVQTPLIWADAMETPGTTPTLAQMRDPNWSGYKWNAPTNYPEASEIDNMLNATCVQNGKCKVSINLRLAATSGDDPPAFMKANGWAWEGTGAADNNERIKFYNSTARQYAENFVYAALHRFDDPDISSVKFDEYFPGTTKPGDWTTSGGQDAYEDGYYDFFTNVLADAPTDANGDRVTIYQTNPMDNADAFTQSQTEAQTIGIAASDPYMFSNEPAAYSIRKSLHGSVPLSAPLDAPRFNNGYTVKYEGTANPFGYNYGQNIAVTTKQVAWYFGHCGPTPMDSEFIAKPGLPTIGLEAALDQFGPGGSDFSANCSAASDDWGGVTFKR
jgi:hypothetical protein